MVRRVTSILVLVLLVIPMAARAQQTGRVVAVDPSAVLLSGGRAHQLRAGDHVPTGSTIQTGPSGRVQMLFPDGTKIVVAAGSAMTIDDTLFTSGNVAQDFRVSAVGGAFRFISGGSPKNVYGVSTPVATMGVRGTAFDFAVEGGQATHLLVYEGQVEFCAGGTNCAQVPGGCRAVSAQRGGRFSQPRSNAQKQRLLQQTFPLIAQQAELQPAFRADISGCGRYLPITLPGENDLRRPGERSNDGGGDHSGNPAE